MHRRRMAPPTGRSRGLALFRRRRPLHEELARAGGLSEGLRLDGDREPGLAAQVPGWSGAQRGEAGIHGVPRARRWDAVATADVPGLTGNAVEFVALGDGTLIVSEDEPDEPVARLADALEDELAAPYRAEAVRRDGDTWAVAARRIRVVEVPGLRGEEAELVVTPSGWTLRVDGRTSLQHAPALERAGADAGPEFVVRAARVDGELWEVEATPL
jgi:hypothetical protein